MPLVMLKKTADAPFRRRVLRDEKGKPAGEPLVFNPGEPREVTEAELEALKPDLGKALSLVVMASPVQPKAVEEVAEAERRRAAAEAAEQQAAAEKASREQAAADVAARATETPPAAETSANDQPVRSRRHGRHEALKQD